MNAVDEEIDGSKSTCEIGSPPPVVVLGTKVKVTEKNCSLRTGDDEDDKDKEQESKHVICLLCPDTIEYEEQLDEDTSKGQHSPHDDPRDRFGVDGLVWDLSWDLVGAHRMLNRPFLESEVCANKCERYRDAEPECQESNQGGEGDGCTGSLNPQHQI